MTNEEILKKLYQVVAPKYREAVAEGIKALEHFKRGTFTRTEDGEYKCSVCGHHTASEFDMEDEYFEFNGGHGWALKTPHYCKHCGAYMREDEDNDN